MILTILREGESPRQVDVEGAEIFLGKHAECQVVLTDSKVSRRHVRLTVENGKVFAEDLKSTNGSSLGGAPLTGRAEFAPGAELQIGPFVIKRPGATGAAAAAPPPAAAPPAAPVSLGFVGSPGTELEFAL